MPNHNQFDASTETVDLRDEDDSIMTRDKPLPSQPDVDNAGTQRKKTKKRRYYTAPSEQHQLNTSSAPPRPSALAEMPDKSKYPEVVESAENKTDFEHAVEDNVEGRSLSPLHAQTEHVDQISTTAQHDGLKDDADVLEVLPPGSATDISSKTLSHAQLREPGGSPESFRPQNSDHDSHNTIERATHYVSDQSTSVRVRKRKAKKPRNAAPGLLHQAPASELSSDVNDYVQILAYKIRQHEQHASASVAAERENHAVELQHIGDAKQVLQDELDDVVREKDNLSAAIDDQKRTIGTYGEKVNKFKRYITGLGKDFDALREEANTTRAKCEKLTDEARNYKEERKALFDQLNTCTQASAQLKEQTLETCQQSQSQLNELAHHNKYLELRLHEKVGMLTEERDRRAQLEQQLAKNGASSEDMLRAITSSNSAILEKLYEVQESFQQGKENEEATDMLQKAFAAVQALSSETTVTMEDVSTVKGLVETANEKYMHIRMRRD